MLSRGIRFLLAGSLSACVASQSASQSKYPPLPVGTLTAGHDMTSARSGQTATVLPDLRFLIAGGRGRTGVLATTEIYDPTTEKFTAAARMTVPRAGHIAAVLEDSKILIAGGQTSGGAALSSSEDYDFETGEFTRRGNMHARRMQMAAVVLRDGRVLVTGGEDGTKPLDSAETYDVLTGKWTLVGKMSAARASHSATLLSDGRVLIAGGTGAQRATLASAEIFDPKTNQFTATGSLHEARSQHTSARLTNGKVLIAGGAGGPGETNILASAEIYDPQKGTFTVGGSMNEPRFRLPDSVSLLDGRVAVVGGAASVEIYDPSPRRQGFQTLKGGLDTVRYYPAVIQLMDGSLRIFGGSDPKGVSTAKTWSYRP